MKRGWILFILIVFVLTSILFLSLVSAQTCNDPDGKNYYTQGSVINESFSFQDSCIDGKTLEEGLCSESEAYKQSYTCSESCSNGACLCPTTKCEGGMIYGPENCKVENNVCICPSCPAVTPTTPTSNQTQTCSPMPTCRGAKDTGQVDSDGCPIYSCLACEVPCDGAVDTGSRDGNNCPIFKCPTTPVCSDSDNGKNIYQQGVTSGLDWGSDNKVEKTDYCITEGEKAGRLAEYFCNYINGGYRVASETFECASGCKYGACVKGEEIKEQVKCLFGGSNQEQKCYTAEQNSRAYCSGVESCVTGILGYQGEQITWKSTCGGYAYTVVDGNNEYAKFSCGNIEFCQPTKCDDGSVYDCKIINGQCICPTCPQIIVKPVCGNGICEGGEGEVCTAVAQIYCEEGKECKVPKSSCYVNCPQDCKKTDGIYAKINEKFKLQVYQPVKIIENENHLIKITFKDLIAYKCKETEVSSSAAQVIESKVASEEIALTGNIITGNIISETSTSSGGGGGQGVAVTTSPAILKCIGAGPKALLDVDMIVNNELGKHMILNLDAGEKKQIDEFTISFLGYDYASRTGAFLVSREAFACPEKCKCDENGKVIECWSEVCKEGETLCSDGVCREKCEIISEECKFGCLHEGKCFPMGIRSKGLYCSTDLIMNSQLSADETCDNNFECSSNVCVAGKCISEGFINRILNWFKRIFGGD